METYCGIRKNRKTVFDFFNQWKSKLIDETSGEEFLTSFIQTFGENELGLKQLQYFLDKEQININVLPLLKNLNQHQTHPLFKQFELTKDGDAIITFKNNIGLLRYIDARFAQEIFKVCVLNTDLGCTHPIIDSNSVLQTNIADFKQGLLKKLILQLSEYNPELMQYYRGYVAFDGKFGADNKLYDIVMQAAYDVLSQSDISDIDMTSPKSQNAIEIYYNVIALNNFDYFLDKSLDGIIKKSKPHQFGDLNRTKYELAAVKEFDDNVVDRHLISEHDANNATNFVSPTTKKIISTIPAVRYNLKGKNRFYYDQNKSTLQLNHVMQMSYWIKSNLSVLKDLFGLQDLDLQNDPIGSVKQITKVIYDSIKNYSNTPYKYLSIKDQKIKKFIKENNSKSAISTVISLYEFLWNEDERLDDTTRSIDFIVNMTESSKSLRFNIINQIIQQIQQVVAPAFIEYPFHGLLVDSAKENSIQQGFLQKSDHSNVRYAFLNPIKRAVAIEGLKGEESDIVKGILNNKRHTQLESELNDSNGGYLRAVKKLLNIQDSNDEHVKALLIEAEQQLGTGNVLFTMFAKIATLIKDYKPTSNAYQNSKFINDQLQLIISNTNYDIIGQVLGSILNPTPSMTFTSLTGNQIGIYRNTSGAFMIDHARNRYKQETKEESDLAQYGYIPIRKRSNVLIDVPGLLEKGRNASYLSQIAIPLTIGNDKAAAVDYNKVTADKQAVYDFVGNFFSLMMGVKNKQPNPMLAIQLGTYSDKSTIPLLMLNGLAQFDGGLTLQKLISDPDLALQYTQAYSSVKTLDLVNHIIDDWVKIFKAAITEQLDWTGDEINLEFIEYLKTCPELNQITSIHDVLRSPEHSELFQKFKESPTRSDTFHNLMIGKPNEKSRAKIKQGNIKQMKDQLELNIKLLNVILSHMPNSFMKQLVPEIASRNNLKIVDILYADKYKLDPTSKKETYQFNRTLLEDLRKDCTIQKYNSNILESLYQPENPDYAYYHFNMALRGLKYGKEAPMLDLLTSWFADYKALVLSVLKKTDSSNKDRVTLFDNLYTENFEVSRDNLARLYFGYLIVTNFFRHQALDLTVKEAYEDKAKKKNTIEEERGDRQKTTAKRNNAFTATMIPFMMNLVDGISKHTNISVIDDIPGGVFNTLGIDRNVDEFDGLGFVSPIQCRMEDASLCHNHRVSTKKTFIVPVSDYNAEELKWASNEITNQKIRESLGCQRSLLSIFKRMHNIPFDEGTNICEQWRFKGQNTIYLSTLLDNKLLICREGKKYYRYDSITYNGQTFNGKKNVTQYIVTKVEVDPTTGKDLISLDEDGNNIYEYNSVKTIDSIWDIYQALNGINCGQFINGEFKYTEDIMDLLYEITCNTGIKIGEEINQHDIQQPLRSKFIGILATKSANKRGSSNIVSGEAWENDNIPLSFSTVELAVGGKQLDAEHHADGSSITKGTQLMQDLAQKGYTHELVNNLYNAISKVMEHSSEKFNSIIRLLGQQNQKSQIQSKITQKIIQDLELLGTTEDIQNLLQEFQNESKELGEDFIVPLSAIITDVLKTYAPELNKNVIKQKDSGLMGTLTGSSGFIQSYQFNGKNYTMGDFLTQKNIDRIHSKYGEQINNFILNTRTIKSPYINPNPTLLHDEIIKLISLSELSGNFDSLIKQLGGFDNVINTLLNPNSRIKTALTEMYKSQSDSLLGYRKIPVTLVRPGMTVLNVHDKEELLPIDLITGEPIVDPAKYERVLIDSNKKIASLVNSTEYVLVDDFTPVDLQPQVFEIHTKFGHGENEYTSFEAQLGFKIQNLIDGKFTLDDLTLINNLLDYISTKTTDPKYLVLKQNINDSILTNEDIKVLVDLQERCQMFHNSLKSFGFSLGKYNGQEFSKYYRDFNPLEDVGEQVAAIHVNSLLMPDSVILADKYRDKLSKSVLEGTVLEDYHPSKDGKIILNPEKVNELKNQIIFYLQNSEINEYKKQTLETALDDDNTLINLLLWHPQFFYNNILQEDKDLYREQLLYTAGFDEITSKVQKKASIIMPNIFKGSMKLGGKNLVDVTPETFSKEGAHYNIHDEQLDSDFVIRSFKGTYNIVLAKNLTDENLSIFGDTIKETDITVDNEGYRINSNNKTRMYKLPSTYIIKKINGVETIIIKDTETGWKDALQLMSSDDNLISIEPLLANASNSNSSNILDILDQVNQLNTIPGFEEHYIQAKQILKSGTKEQILNLNTDLINLHNNEDTRKHYETIFQNSMYQAFRRSLDMMVTRIPTQNMSSIMPMEVVGFTSNDVNDVFVTKWQNWLQGSDFDIDKAFILGYNFDKNGRFILWSKLQKTFNEELFNRSMNFPLPDQYNEAIYSKNSDQYMNNLFDEYQLLLDDNYDSLLDKYKIDRTSSNIKDQLQIEILIRILKREQSIGKILIDKRYESLWNNNLSNLLKLHHNTSATDGGIKNYATYQMHQIMNNPMNATSAYKSIDVATDAFSNPISKLSEDHVTNIDDGHSIYEGTESGAVGKDDVGIAANGTKAQFSLLQYFNTLYATDTPLSVEELVNQHYYNVRPVQVPYIDENGKYTIWNKNIATVGDARLFNGLKQLYINSVESNVYFFDNDASQGVGALLSMSADNAKTLNMDKLNAVPNLFASHIFLSIIGCPEEIIVKFSNSPVFELIVDIAKTGKLNSLSFLFLAKELQDPVQKQVLEYIEDIYESGKEISALASMLSINQGVHVTEEEIVKQHFKLNSIYRQALQLQSEEFIISDEDTPLQTKRKEKANALLAKCGITLLDEFNLYRYLTDATYAECIKSVYDVVKKHFNIFDVIDQLSHFKKMFLKYSQLQQINADASELFRQETIEINQVYNKAMQRRNPENQKKRQPLYKPQYTENYSSGNNIDLEAIYEDMEFDIDSEYGGSQENQEPDFILPSLYNATLSTISKRVIEETVLENFIREEASKSSFKFDNSTSDNKIIYECDFQTDDALHTFMDFVTNVVIPQLIIQNPENRFLNGLMVNNVEVTKNHNVFYQFDVNLRSLINADMIGITEFKAIKDAFEKIKDIKLSDLLQNTKEFYIADPNTTVGDFLYLYDRIVKIVNPTAQSIGALFTDYKPNTFKGKFSRLWKAYDTGKKKLVIRPEVLLAAQAKPMVKYHQEDGLWVKNIEFHDGIEPIVYSKKQNGEVIYTKYLLGMPVKKEIDRFVVLSDIFQNALLSGKLKITELIVDCE